MVFDGSGNASYLVQVTRPEGGGKAEAQKKVFVEPSWLLLSSQKSTKIHLLAVIGQNVIAESRLAQGRLGGAGL